MRRAQQTSILANGYRSGSANGSLSGGDIDKFVAHGTWSEAKKRENTIFIDGEFKSRNRPQGTHADRNSSTGMEKGSTGWLVNRLRLYGEGSTPKRLHLENLKYLARVDRLDTNIAKLFYGNAGKKNLKVKNSEVENVFLNELSELTRKQQTEFLEPTERFFYQRQTTNGLGTERQKTIHTLNRCGWKKWVKLLRLHWISPEHMAIIKKVCGDINAARERIFLEDHKGLSPGATDEEFRKVRDAFVASNYGRGGEQ